MKQVSNFIGIVNLDLTRKELKLHWHDPKNHPNDDVLKVAQKLWKLCDWKNSSESRDESKSQFRFRCDHQTSRRC